VIVRVPSEDVTVPLFSYAFAHCHLRMPSKVPAAAVVTYCAIDSTVHDDVQNFRQRQSPPDQSVPSQQTDTVLLPCHEGGGPGL